MFKAIPGNDDYMISLSGEIVRTDNTACTLVVIDNKVYIKMFNKEQWLDIKWLSLIAHYEVRLPKQFHRRYDDIHFVPGSSSVRGGLCQESMVFIHAFRLPDGYRVIPNYTNYAVNEHGTVIDLVNGVCNTRCNPDGYPIVKIYDPDRSVHREIMVHRLVAFAFIGNDDRITNCVVNHLDGNKFNSYYKNLEWTSFSGNAIHAFAIGLRDDNQPCLVRDATSGVISNFISIRQACRFMNVRDDQKLADLQYVRAGKLISGRYEIKLENDITPWFYNDRDEVIKQGRYHISITWPDETVEEFHDGRDLQKRLRVWNLRPNTVHECIRQAEIKYPGLTAVITDQFDNQEVEAHIIHTGVTVNATSMANLARLLDIPVNIVRSAIKHGESRESNGYRFRFKSDEPWSTSHTTFQCIPVCILATNSDTRETLSFTSLRAAAEHFNIDRSAIKNRLRNGKMYLNWTFKKQ